MFVNGVEVVNHEGGFLPFDANVTEIVRYNQYNKLTVLANNELNEYMLPAGQRPTPFLTEKRLRHRTLISTITRVSTARSSCWPCPKSVFWILR